MASRLTLHLQLSTIMETMSKTVLGQVFKLVDEDSADLRSELSRLQFANTALAEKVHSLECELTIVRNNPSKMCKSHRSLGVQTVSCRDEEEAPNGISVFRNCKVHKTFCINNLSFFNFTGMLV